MKADAPADPGKDHGTVAQTGTVTPPAVGEPPVTNVMIAAGISQLPSVDWTLAEITKTLRLVYQAMWRLREGGTP